MNPGTLTHQITIQRKSIAQDAELNAIETWMDWRTVWAQLLPKSGKEYYRLSIVNSEITEAFEMRYISGVSPHQRIKFKGKYLEIIDAINPGEKNLELIITCKGAV